MSDPDVRASTLAESVARATRRRRGRATGWRGVLIRWLDIGPAPPAAPTPVAASDVEADPPALQPIDLVDQAEAFATLRVADVMTPRADIVGLELATPLREVVARFVEVELTRLPIYRETLDDPIGVVHIKDVVRLIAPAADGGAPPWDEAVLARLRREALYVPASMRGADLLLRMRVSRSHMALVIDEFGGTDGLVTMEDLVEAVVGDIDDEHDEAGEPDIVARPGGVLEAAARAPLEDLEARLGLSLVPEGVEEEIDTVGGLVTALAGRLPQRGEVIVHPAGFEFEVMDADPRRIRRLRIRPAQAPADLAPAAPDPAPDPTPDPTPDPGATDAKSA